MASKEVNLESMSTGDMGLWLVEQGFPLEVVAAFEGTHPVQ
jgi:hypothetical protein